MPLVVACNIRHFVSIRQHTSAYVSEAEQVITCNRAESLNFCTSKQVLFFFVLLNPPAAAPPAPTPPPRQPENRR
jgi:hypothetical protein